jgi:drug/metabolite transporter (DMT)-like permease
MREKGGDAKGQIQFAFHIFCILSVFSLLLLFFDLFSLHGNPYYLFLLSLTCAIFGALTSISAYVAQKHVEAGVTTLVSNIYTPITIVLSSIFVREGLNNLQILGTALLLIAMVIVGKKHRIGRFRFDKYFMLTLLSGVFVSILLVAERTLQHKTGFTAGTMLSWWSQAIALGIVSFFVNTKHNYTKKEVWLTGTLRSLQALSFVILVFIVGNLSIVSSITTFKIVVVFIAAAIFLKEREDLPRKIFGCIIALAGLLLMG